MLIIAPIPTTIATLTSTNVTESDYSAYVAGTTYALANRVIVIADHAIYESIQAANVGHTPSTSPTWWVKVSATNAWKMFDQYVGTSTTNLNSIDVKITPGIWFDSLALMELSASSVQVQITDPVYGLVYNNTITLINDNGINDWGSYFFNLITRKTTALFTDLPYFPAANIEIIITDTGSTVSCGVCLVGTSTYVGNAQYGSSIGIQDYSTKIQDAWGAYSIVPRAFRKRAKFTLSLEDNLVDSVAVLLASLRATPALYIGSTDYDAMMVYGFFKDFDINIKYPTYSEYTLDIEGLV